MLLRLRPRRTRTQQLAVEVDGVLHRLASDRAHALQYWSAWRSKEALLEIVASGWRDLDAAALLELTVDQLLAVDAFFGELERFALWLRCTEAMPATLEARYDLAVEVLTRLGQAAIHLLGGLPPDAPPRPDAVWGPRGG